MKLKIITTIILLLGFRSCFAQEQNKHIESQFRAYLATLVNKDFQKSMGYMYPAFFKFVPKEQLIAAMEKTFNNPALEFEIKNPKVLEVGPLTKIADQHYVLLKYSNELLMRYKHDTENLNKEDIASRLATAKLSLQKTFGKENVKLDAQTAFFQIYSEKMVCAISSYGKSDWKFVVMEPKQRIILERLLPKEIMAKL